MAVMEASMPSRLLDPLDRPSGVDHYFKVNESMGSDAGSYAIIARWEIAANKLSEDAKNLQSGASCGSRGQNAEAAAKGDEC